jgi:hypothetical protein
MNLRKTIFWLTLALSCLATLTCAFAEERQEADAKPPLRAAIFIQNRAGKGFQDKIDALGDLLSARLTEKGFSVIDRADVVAKFRESRERDKAVQKAVKLLIDLGSKKNEASVEDSITGASALRIAQMIGADYLIFGTITSAGQERRRFKGKGTVYGTDNEVTIKTLRVALKVLEGNQGGTVYGDVITVSERVATVDRLEVESSDTANKLLGDAAVQAAENIAGKVERIRTAKVKSVPTVEFQVTANVEGAAVELDGAVIGSAPGHFNAAPGLHQVKVTRQWMITWERTVNIFPNMILNVSLELSDEGTARFMTMEGFKAAMAREKQDRELEAKEREAGVGIAKEQSEADAYSKKKVSEGTAEYLKNYKAPQQVIMPAAPAGQIQLTIQPGQAAPAPAASTLPLVPASPVVVPSVLAVPAAPAVDVKLPEVSIKPAESKEAPK